MIKMKASNLEEQLKKHKVSSQQQQFNRTKKQYFSLPKLDGQHTTTSKLNKLQNIQLCKFPQNPILNTSFGFKKFKVLQNNQIRKQKNSLKKILDCITENSREFRSYHSKYLFQKQNLLSNLDRTIQRDRQLASKVKSIHLNHITDQQISNFNIRQSQTNIKNKHAQYSDHLQSIIFPKYKRERQKKIQQKLKHQLQIRKKYNDSFHAKMSINVLPAYGQIPECREGSQIFAFQNKLYILGGSSNSTRHFIQYLDLKTNQWGKIQIQNYRRRSFFNAIQISQCKVLCVGGYRQGGIYDKRRLTPNLQILDLLKKNITTLLIPKKLQPRSNLSSLLLQNNNLMITGGRNFQKFYNDVMIINLDSGQLQKSKDLPFKSGLASHVLCNTDKGIFLYGGLTGQGELNNKMYNYDEIKKTFIEIATYGIQPKQCYGHVMNYLKKLNLIIIYGGRNDYFSNPFLNQIFIYHIGLSMYTQIENNHIQKQLKKNQKPRLCFAANYNFDGGMYIYGGTNMDGHNNIVYSFNFQLKFTNKL